MDKSDIDLWLEAAPCERCEGEGFFTVDVSGGDSPAPVTVDCDCECTEQNDG